MVAHVRAVSVNQLNALQPSTHAIVIYPGIVDTARTYFPAAAARFIGTRGKV